MEDSPNFNKRTVLNKHAGWKNTKILINAQDEINARSNFCLYIQNFKNGTKWEKWIKLALKGGKFGKYWWKSPKYLRKKPKFNKHTVFNNRTGWIFFQK